MKKPHPLLARTAGALLLSAIVSDGMACGGEPAAGRAGVRTVAARQEPVAAPAPVVTQPPQPPLAVVDAPPRRQASFALDDFESLALANNPSLTEASAAVQAARGRCTQAGLYPNPIVYYSGQEIGNNGAAGQQGFLLQQEFVRGDKLNLSQQAALAAVRQAEARLRQQQLRVLTSVRMAWFEALAAERMTEVATELDRIGADSVSVVDRLLQAKEAARVDLLDVKIESEKARIALNTARNRRAAAWRQLTAQAGVPHLESAPLMGHFAEPPQPLAWDEALGALLGESPELAEARAAVSEARWTLRRACAEPTPNVDIQAGPAYDYGTNNTVAFIQAGVIVPLYNRNQGAIRAAQAEVRRTVANAERIELLLQHRLAETHARYESARLQAERYHSEILPAATESRDLVRKGFEQGQFPLLRLLNSQRTYFETSAAALTSLRDAWAARAEIDGLLLSGGLSAVGP